MTTGAGVTTTVFVISIGVGWIRSLFFEFIISVICFLQSSPQVSTYEVLLIKFDCPSV